MARVLNDEYEFLSDLEEEDDPIPIAKNPFEDEEEYISIERFRALLTELDRERKNKEVLESSNNRLKLVAHEAIKQREDTLKEKEQALNSNKLLRSEIEATSQILVSTLQIFSSGELPKSPKYTEFPDLAFEISKRSNEIVDVYNSRLKLLESKLEEKRPLMNDQLRYISKIHDQIHCVMKIVDANDFELPDSLAATQKMDMDEDFRDTLAGLASIYELTNVTVKKVRNEMEKRMCEIKGLNDIISQLVKEKHHIGSLLRSFFSNNFSLSEMREVIRVVENGLKEKGLDIKFSDAFVKHRVEEMEQEEAYNLAGALESIIRASQLEVTELQHTVDALRAESNLLKAHVEAQTKELSQRKHHVLELEVKERSANEKDEGLMMGVTAADEEITRWKVAAEQEAATGRAVEQIFLSQVSALQKELVEAKKAMLESEKNLKIKEDTATAAMVWRDAAEKSLRLADLRNSKLRDRLEDLSHQLESVTQKDLQTQNMHRYACWPWQWLGLNFVGYNQAEKQQQYSQDTKLSEPLV